MNSTSTPFWNRRRCLRVLSAGAALGAMSHPAVRVWAKESLDFVVGPPVPDIAPIKISPHVYLIYAKNGFPTPEDQGMMSNVCFVVTPKGVVILDSGSSLQIGQMALRMIKTVTPLPVVAVFNSHYHGDHWLGNDAFAQAYGPNLAIYALPMTIERIKGVEGNAWLSLMEKSTNGSTLGTRVVAPNQAVAQGKVFDFGQVQLKCFHYGTAHTPSDLSIQVLPDNVTAVGDIAMANRIANIEEGSYPGTFAYYDKLSAAAPDQLWLPGHGMPSKTLLDSYGTFLRGIWEPCLLAVKEGKSEAQAKQMVLADPRVSSRAKTMQGFDSNIGKYISLAYLEAEKLAF